MKENKIQTAEKFLNDIRYITYSTEEKLIIFAKLHTKAALENASDQAHIDIFSKNKNHRWVKMIGETEFDPTNFEHKYVVNKKSILSAYPDDLIK